MIQQRITQYIEKNHLFSSDSKILVALSGGADSVALLRILHTEEQWDGISALLDSHPLVSDWTSEHT